ncbi:MAG TPA: hypothetical protein PLF84_10565, partial [Bryobacteraceae bacterium]|nr:hypothetical protein [Bryobacteraceae bacterium]
CEGNWWLPGHDDKDDKRVFGTLRFSRQEGAHLSLAGSLLTGLDAETAPDIILGETVNGIPVTLLHPMCIHERIPLATGFGPTLGIYHAPILFLGARFDDLEDMRFSSWQVRFPELLDWVGKRNIVVDHPAIQTSTAECPTVRIGYTAPPKRVLLSAAGEMNLALGFGHRLKQHSGRGVALQEDIYLEIRRENSDTLEDYWQAATRFEYFLALATNGLVSISSIWANIETDKPQEARRSPRVRIMYQPIRNSSRRQRNRTSRPLFTLSEIAGMESDCLRKWYSSGAWLDTVCALNFGTLFNPSKYQDLSFLTLVQALEAYHRSVHPNTDMPKAVHESRLERIIEAAPPEDRQWLGEKLQFSNELSLRRRLKLVFKQFACVLADVLPDGKATASKICDTRNFLTHRVENLREGAASDADLIRLIEVVRLLLQACLLHEMGLGETQIKDFTSRSESARLIRHLTR